MEVGKKGKVHVEDIVFLIRKDAKKYARVKVRNKVCAENFYNSNIVNNQHYHSFKILLCF